MILGIDTSAYTTSLAIVEKVASTVPILDIRQVLQVPFGQRGLRQSDAVYQHVQNFSHLADQLRHYSFTAISVSDRPRPRDESYMPVFKVGQAFAQILAATHQVPLYRVSHQEGHIAAGLWSSKCELEYSPVLALHISGGTSDVMMLEREGEGFTIAELGCSSDLHAGQFVDRVGVVLGAAFPSGSQMDQWSQEISDTVLRIPSVVHGYDMSFSGPESAAQRLVSAGHTAPNVSRAVFVCIARTVEKVIRYAYTQKDYGCVLLVGGVACNSVLRAELLRRLPYNIYFCNTMYSSDNAVGVALLGAQKAKGNGGQINVKTD